jgi:hypothetical protein
VRWVGNVANGQDDRRQTLTKIEFVEGGTMGPVGGNWLMIVELRLLIVEVKSWRSGGATSKIKIQHSSIVNQLL